MTKVLIVDDDEVITELLRDCLDALGFDVATDTQGLDALRKMLHMRPDVVISDLAMPGMGGAPLLTAMQENAYLSEIPVILMSGSPEHEVRVLCRGYAAFLAKPFAMDEMVTVVRRLARPATA